MADLLAVVLSGVLGASLLAVVLLYRAHRRDRARITQLSAELAVQKLTAMTLGMPVPAPHAQRADAVRRKGHLSLYIGGGVVAALASFADRLRHAWHGHRVATATVTVAAASVAAVGAFALASGDDPQPPGHAPSSTGAIEEPDPYTPGDQPTDNAVVKRELSDDNPLAQALPDDLTDRLLRGSARFEEPTPHSGAPAPVTSEGSRGETGTDAPHAANTPAPETTTPSTPSNPDEVAPTEAPASSEAAPPQESPLDCTVGVELPVLDLCVP